MEGYEIRLKVEYSQLKSKIISLRTFLGNIEYKVADISEEEHTLLKEQLDAMVAYHDILEKRCKIHNINI